MKIKSFLSIATLATALLLGGIGCTTTISTKASALKPAGGATVNLRDYSMATIIPFSGSPAQDGDVGERFATDIAARLKQDFGPLFQSVRMKEEALRQPGELVVTGNIRSYKPGSRAGRMMLIGVTPAVFKADLVLKDGLTGKELLSAPIDKLWAWGGLMGAAKGIEEMLTESAAAAARTVAEGKGWNSSASTK